MTHHFPLKNRVFPPDLRIASPNEGGAVFSPLRARKTYASLYDIKVNVSSFCLLSPARCFACLGFSSLIVFV